MEGMTRADSGGRNKCEEGKPSFTLHFCCAIDIYFVLHEIDFRIHPLLLGNSSKNTGEKIFQLPFTSLICSVSKKNPLSQIERLLNHPCSETTIVSHIIKFRIRP